MTDLIVSVLASTKACFFFLPYIYILFFLKCWNDVLAMPLKVSQLNIIFVNVARVKNFHMKMVQQNSTLLGLVQV